MTFINTLVTRHCHCLLPRPDSLFSCELMIAPSAMLMAQKLGYANNHHVKGRETFSTHPRRFQVFSAVRFPTKSSISRRYIQLNIDSRSFFYPSLGTHVIIPKKTGYANLVNLTRSDSNPVEEIEKSHDIQARYMSQTSREAPTNELGFVLRLLDWLIVFIAEAAKSATQQTFLLIGQLINGAVGLFLTWTVEPGYNAARRARLAVARAAGNLAQRSKTKFAVLSNILEDIEARVNSGDGASQVSDAGKQTSREGSPAMSLTNLLQESGEIIAHQNQPRHTFSPGLVEELRIGVLVKIDSLKFRCRRAVVRIHRGQFPLSCCNRRSQQHRDRKATLSLITKDLIEPQLLALSTSHMKLQARKAAEEKRRSRSLSPIKEAGKTPPKGDGKTYHAGQRASKAYRPFPKLAKLSAACYLIDTVYGYPVQTYAVRTVDGYILTLVRIPRVESRKVVLFQHGLLDSASAWISTGNVHSLASRAYQSGYDVFLGNMRGSNDALGINGLGANPADYRDRSKRDTAAANRAAKSPLRGRQRSASVVSERDFVGVSVDGIPVHETLHPRQPEYWNYSVDDHALDVMAFMRQIRIIKALEHSERRQQNSAARPAAQNTQAEGSGSSDGTSNDEEADNTVHGTSVAPMESVREAVAGPNMVDIGDAVTGLGDAESIGAHNQQVEHADRRDALEAPAFGFPSPVATVKSTAASDGEGTSTHTVIRHHRKHSRAESPPVLATPPPEDVTIDATSTLADDCDIIGVGHSMGGCILLMYILISNALQRPHWLKKLVLLSPAGIHRHIAWYFRAALRLLHYSGLLKLQGPFPMRSSKLQRFGARLLQDLKRTQAVGDLMAVLGSYFFGGERHRFVFRFVSFTDYPIGGTNFKVLRHGIQTMLVNEFQPYDHGKEENVARYQDTKPPSYRVDYWLFDAPIHMIAGGRDMLVPAKNLEEQFSIMNMLNPGIATMREFDKAGHLDFTLTLSDDIITHVLNEIESGFTGRRQLPPDYMQIAHDVNAVGHNEPTSRASRGPLRYSPPSVLADVDISRDLHNVVQTANGRRDALTSRPSGRTARECAKDFPWLCAFTKLDAVLDGLDIEATEMGIRKS